MVIMIRVFSDCVLYQPYSRYDTMCSDDPKTIIIRTDAVNGISSLVLENGAGSVIVEAG